MIDKRNNKLTITKSEFYYYASKLKEAYNFYQEQFYQKEFRLYLANGTYLEIYINENNLPHLLGLLIRQIRESTGFIKMTSIEIMKLIMNYPNYYYDVLNNYKGIENFVSSFWENKLESFHNLEPLNVKNITFLSYYEPEFSDYDFKLYGNTKYVLGFKKGNKYTVLGFANNDSIYVPVTNLLLKENEMSGYFKHQVIIPISYSEEIVADEVFRTIMTSKEKQEKIRQLKKIKRAFRFSSIDSSNDFIEDSVEKETDALSKVKSIYSLKKI